MYVSITRCRANDPTDLLPLDHFTDVFLRENVSFDLILTAFEQTHGAFLAQSRRLAVHKVRHPKLILRLLDVLIAHFVHLPILYIVFNQ
jgi:hypothetical protein